MVAPCGAILAVLLVAAVVADAADVGVGRVVSKAGKAAAETHHKVETWSRHGSAKAATKVKAKAKGKAKAGTYIHSAVGNGVGCSAMFRGP